MLLGATGNASNLLQKASQYLIGVVIGLPAMNAWQTLNGYMIIDNDKKLSIYKEDAHIFDDFNEAKAIKKARGGKVIKL